MNGKTKIVFDKDDGEYGEWIKGDTGYIDGYVQSNNVPYMIVINLRTSRPVFVPFHNIVTVIQKEDK